ncbi:hypothetical protein D0504_05405 [Weissella confusa]|uniref:DUF6275 family protein n=1 Tax=Weissella confusa TaxID=1583 RepID=UPI0021BE4821|nr:DUF6275 family protein [Weissella confusa]MCT8393171.1 hypothetical protein [Weissella confusa]
MDAQKFINKAKRHIEYKTDVYEDDQFVVWQSKFLQNNKALISWFGTGMILVDGVERNVDYVEATYDVDKDEFYFDWYAKEANEAVKL